MTASNDAPFTISRPDAIATGQHWYFLKPCHVGHTAKRLVSNKACLECHRLRRAKIRAEQPERVKAAKAASYQRNRASVIAAVTAYTEANRKKVRERRKKHREANKERLAATYAEWAKANRPKLRVHERNRRERHRGAEGKHTLADIQRIQKAQKNRCANPTCRVSLRDGFHIDHIQPIALGGTNWPRNIQLLCQPCNQSKHAKPPIEWAQSQGLLL